MTDGKNDPSKSGEDFDPISPLPGDKVKAPPHPAVPSENPSKRNEDGDVEPSAPWNADE